jgi:hypothetical protein
MAKGVARRELKVRQAGLVEVADPPRARGATPPKERAREAQDRDELECALTYACDGPPGPGKYAPGDK